MGGTRTLIRNPTGGKNTVISRDELAWGVDCAIMLKEVYLKDVPIMKQQLRRYELNSYILFNRIVISMYDVFMGNYSILFYIIEWIFIQGTEDIVNGGIIATHNHPENQLYIVI